MPSTIFLNFLSIDMSCNRPYITLLLRYIMLTNDVDTKELDLCIAAFMNRAVSL